MQGTTEKTLGMSVERRERTTKQLLLCAEHRGVEAMTLYPKQQQQEVDVELRLMEAKHHSWNAEPLCKNAGRTSLHVEPRGGDVAPPRTAVHPNEQRDI